MIDYWRYITVCLSVRLSVALCIAVKLHQVRKKEAGSFLGITLTNLNTVS